jgi:excisionase family DNA binding protein
MADTLLTPEQVAQRLQVTERTVYKWLSEGRLKGTKLGRLWRIRPEDLEAYLDPNGRNGDDADEEYDDEPLSAEDWAAIREGIDAIRRGDTVTLEEYDRERQQSR